MKEIRFVLTDAEWRKSRKAKEEISREKNHCYSWKDYFMLMSKGVSEK